MPTYDYQCHSCGFITEIVHSMLDDGPTECERCGGQLRRVIHPTGIIFKGGGFYKTDSRSPSSSGSTSESSRGNSPATSPTDSTASEKSSAPSSSGGGSAKGNGGGD